MHFDSPPPYSELTVDTDLEGMPVFANGNSRGTMAYYVKICAIIAAFASPWPYWIYSFSEFTTFKLDRLADEVPPLGLYEKSWWPNYFQDFAANAISDHLGLSFVILWIATGGVMVIIYDLYSHAREIERGLEEWYEPIRSSVDAFVSAWIASVIFFALPFSFVVFLATVKITRSIYGSPQCSGDTPVHVFLYRGGGGEAPRAEILDPYFPGARASVIFSLNWDSSSNSTDATTLSLSRGGSAEPLNILYDLAAGTATLPELNLAATFDPSNIGLVRIPDLDTTLETYGWNQGSISGASVRSVNGMGSARWVLGTGMYSPGDRSVLGVCVAREEGQTAATVLIPLGLAMYYHAIDNM